MNINMASSKNSSRLSALALAATFCLASSIFLTPVSGHALPSQTISPVGTQNIQSWPLEPTLAPAVPVALVRREFNTVCGYIGGNPDLPATCMRGSHCVVDDEKKAIGCCPDQGDCTTGIFTGCVDENNPGGGVIDPHIFTCGANSVCYKNNFQGGYFQYGCGSASDLATTVALTASGESSLTYMSVSVPFRPTTTMASFTSNDGSNSGSGKSSTSVPSSTATSAGKNGASISADSGKNNHTSAIVGGVVGGLAALILLLLLAAWLWRRNRRPATPEIQEEPKYISRPLASPEIDYEADDNMTGARPAPHPPILGISRQPEDIESWPIPPPMAKSNVIGGANNVADTDQTPLTRGVAVSPPNNSNGPPSPVDSGSIHRRGGERPFWQQSGGGRTRNLNR